MKKVDGAQPNSNPGPNKYDGIWIIECRTRDYSDNQERSSNHQESQKYIIYCHLCHTAVALDFTLLLFYNNIFLSS